MIEINDVIISVSDDVIIQNYMKHLILIVMTIELRCHKPIL